MGRTTLNIHLYDMLKITQASVKLDVSCREVIIMLLKKMMKENRKFRGGFSNTKYQPDDPDKRWHCFPITFKKDENEFREDLRKICKSSVSRIVSIAIEKYLDELIADPKMRHNLYDVTPDLAYPSVAGHLRGSETIIRRLTRLIYADWIPQDNGFVGSCLCL